MKIWEYESLRGMRNAVERTVAEEVVSMLRDHVELNAARLIEKRYKIGNCSSDNTVITSEPRKQAE